jgi:O-antigen/teichoic acid export membrane protein
MSTRSLAADATFLLLAKLVAFGVTFVLPMLLVRQLSQEDFGVYRQLFLLVNTAILLLPFGFVMSAFYFLPRVGARKAAVAMNIVLVYAVVAGLAAVALFAQPGFLATIFDDAALATYSRPIAIVLFMAVVSTFVDLLALANGDVKSAAAFVVATNVAKTAILGTAAILFASVNAILVASILHGVLQVLLLFAYLRRTFGPHAWRVDLPLLWQQLLYAVPLGLAAWLYWLQMESHHYFVARAFGPATYAVYAIGCAGLPLTFMFGESMASVLIHRVSELHTQRRRDEIVRLLGEAVRNLATVYLPLYALLLVVGRDLLAVVYTPRFLASWRIFAIGLTLLPLGILGPINDAVVRSYGECRAFLVGLRVVLVALLLPALWILTPRFGPIAAVSLMVAASMAERLIFTALVARVLQLGWHDAVVLKGFPGIAGTAIAAGTAALIARMVSHGLGHAATLVICTLVFALVYVSILHRQMLDLGASLWARVRGTQTPVAAQEEAA